MPLGSNNIKAVYNNDPGFGVSSASLTETVNPGIPTTTSLIASSTTILAGQVIALSATITATSGSPTGTVTFMDGATLIGTVPLDPATHQAIAFTLSLPFGSDDIMAIYNGDGQFAPSSASLIEAVNA